MASDPTATSKPKPLASEADSSYVKLAMRNMVKNGSTSLVHFGLTILGVLGLLIGLAVVFH
ncbi:DUF3285 domain-containing protein [Pseudanabaena sp. PCC 6802]|uniref:DUF3285 domain-containing protein n=1 Tax=Pseudanabaena sp. PCC 6802 TaxID=118173 RepID=UPI00034CE358|nr:DUF3285 domain-containing protein [Pseudanabaena sp. PCC 6802]